MAQIARIRHVVVWKGFDGNGHFWLWRNLGLAVGTRHLIGDDKRADRIEVALRERKPGDAFDGAELALLNYAEKLTCNPGEMVQADVQQLKDAGVPDGEILEANQIVGYFNYVNRCLNGLGVTTDGDIVGYYAKEDDD